MKTYQNLVDLPHLRRFYDNLKSTGLPINNWEENKKYGVGIPVIKDDKLYRCKTEHTSSSTFDGTKWDLVSGGGGSGITEWEESVTYAVGDVVIYGNNIYECKTTHTSDTEFYPTEWILLTESLSIWDSSNKYIVNDLAVYGDVLYRCIEANEDDVFDSEKWVPVSQDVITDWESSTVYKPYDMVMQDDSLCICVYTHTSSAEFSLDVDNWLVIPTGPAGGYKQVTKLNIHAPLSIDIDIPKTTKFNTPPVEVLKLDGNTTNTTTNVFTFSVGDGDNFNVGDTVASESEDVVFNDTLKLSNDFTYPFSSYSQLDSSNYIFESDTIDLTKYKNVIEVNIT